MAGRGTLIYGWCLGKGYHEKCPKQAHSLAPCACSCHAPKVNSHIGEGDAE